MSFHWAAIIFGFFWVEAMMVAAWWFAKRINNFSIVDSVWALSFFGVGVIYSSTLPGAWIHKVVMLVVLGLWSFRLGGFLGLRILKHHPQEDARYIALRNEYGSRYPFRFFVFYQYQAISVVLLSAPFYFMALNPIPDLSLLEALGMGLFIFSWVLETLADQQKTRFNAQAENRGKNCDVGLWRYSRHPNYFFESLIWFSFAIIAASAPSGWIGFYCAFLMLFLLLKVTGVPMSEDLSLKSRGDVYRAYQRRTSKFIPLPPRE